MDTLVRTLKLVCLALTIFGISKANGLKCFECTISDGDACADPKNNGINITDCDLSIFIDHERKDEIRYRCLYSLEKNSTKSFPTRRCALYSEMIICDPIVANISKEVEMVDCKFCETDYCNSASRLNAYLLYYVVICYLVNKYM